MGRSQHQYLKLADKIPETATNTPITPEELAEHTSLNDAWLSLDGVVYDVTQYIRYHPGGKKIMEGCGIECRDLFSKNLSDLDKYHSWVNGKYLLQKFKVGNLSYGKPKYGNTLN